jgi:hypothetical protein
VSTLSIGQVYNLLRAAGFSPAAAADMTAIAIAESGLNPTIKGDLALQNGTYGPSVGLFQVRTVRAETGRGSDRDINALLGSPARQAQAAYEISHGGKDFRPWSTWLHGSAQAQLARVYTGLGVKNGAALPGTADAPPVTGGGVGAQNAGLSDLIPGAGWIGGLLGIPSAGDVAAKAAKVAIFTGILLTGAALVVLGAYRSVQPAVEAKVDEAKQGLQTAAQIGVLAA